MLQGYLEVLEFAGARGLGGLRSSLAERLVQHSIRETIQESIKRGNQTARKRYGKIVAITKKPLLKRLYGSAALGPVRKVARGLRARLT